ncbi:MAG: hypothetical protein SFW35_08200 [Chitinophagales bacterium]|nr:hypothetical protein [Chitinophagales bacterium]
MSRFLVILFLLPCLSAFCQIEVTDTSGNSLFAIAQGTLTDAGNQQPAFTVRGNIIFHGTSDKKEDIVLLVRAEDIFDKNAGEVLKADMKEVLMTVTKGRFYLGKGPFYDDSKLLGYYKPDSKGNLRIYSGNNTWAASIKASAVTTGEFVLVFYYLMVQKGWVQQLANSLPMPNSSQAAEDDLAATNGTIRRVWGNAKDEYIWNGKIIKRKWNSFDFEEWSFDGTTLKRIWYAGEDDYIWDGQTLKRKWNTGTEVFEWDGSILRRKWNTGTDEYSIQGNIVKRLWNTGVDEEWEIDGEIPIPIIAMVVFGLLGK